jgi:hypothetical protein
MSEKAELTGTQESKNQRLHRLLGRHWHTYNEYVTCDECGVFSEERHGYGRNPDYTGSIQDAF